MIKVKLCGSCLLLYVSICVAIHFIQKVTKSAYHIFVVPNLKSSY